MDNSHFTFKNVLTFSGHLVFWVIIYFFYAYFLGYGSTNTAYVNKFSAFLMPVTVLISYYFIYYLIPNYLLVKKYGLFVLYCIYTIILSVHAIMLSILFGLLYTEELKPENTSPLTKTLPFIILGVFFVVLIVVSLHLIMLNYKTIVNNENLRNKILQTQLQLKEQELKLLKMQIHPHFLFNSLNTIYGYALQKRNEAPEMILKLSNLLDYILYQIEKPQVLLKDEVDHLLDYVSLEKLRFHDTFKVTVNKKIENENSMIAPMILIPFVENSFKHGAIVNGQLEVTINILCANNALSFEIINTALITKENTTGIGLENIKKRLEMLYPKNYSLEIKQEDTVFKVTLKIDNLNQLQYVKPH